MRATKRTISIVMPCLNEERSVKKCITQAKLSLKKLGRLGFSGEIILADNGSTDTSVERAKRAGATIVLVQTRGYGAAYQAGIAASHGRYIVIADSDGTYDLGNIGAFITLLEQGFDLVLGSRFTGNIKPGAMPLLNRYLGNPILTSLLNFTYGTRITDAHTGMRAFTRTSWDTMNLVSSGMEFASEMLMKAKLHNLRITEIPIVYSKRTGTSKLMPLVDAWRHVKCMILYTPTFALILPGILLMLLGFSLSIILLPGKLAIFGIYLDIHTMSMGGLIANLGITTTLLGILSRLYTQKVLHVPGGALGNLILSNITVERLLLSGLLLIVTGLGLIGIVVIAWIGSGFGELSRIREVIFGIELVITGAQLAFSSFVFGLLEPM